MAAKLRVLVVGCGHMGTSHARAFHGMPVECEIVGLVARGAASRRKLNAEFGGRYPEFGDYAGALARTRPDAVCLSTYADTHAAYALAAFAAGAHVFLEKPLADNLADAERVVAAARAAGRKLVLGYILQVHPAWARFTELARTLGKPLVMRMNLNQQSAGASWATHRNLLRTASPLVNCGVHYVNVMCRMTGARPVSVNGIGARLAGGARQPAHRARGRPVVPRGPHGQACLTYPVVPSRSCSCRTRGPCRRINRGGAARPSRVWGRSGRAARSRTGRRA